MDTCNWIIVHASASVGLIFTYRYVYKRFYSRFRSAWIEELIAYKATSFPANPALPTPLPANQEHVTSLCHYVTGLDQRTMIRSG